MAARKSLRKNWYYRALSEKAGTLQKYTGIPAPLFYRLKAGEVKKVGKVTLDKLHRYYKERNYEILREHGASREEAHRRRAIDPGEIDDSINIMAAWAIRRAQKEGISIAAVFEKARKWKTIMEDYEKFDWYFGDGRRIPRPKAEQVAAIRRAVIEGRL